MRTLSAILTVAALVLGMAGSVHAADIFTPSLLSDAGGSGFWCVAVNKSTTSNITVTVNVIAPGLGSIGICGPTVVPPQRNGNCFAGGAGLFAYCKITTSNTSNTRGNLMVLAPALEADSSVDAK